MRSRAKVQQRFFKKGKLVETRLKDMLVTVTASTGRATVSWSGGIKEIKKRNGVWTADYDSTPWDPAARAKVIRDHFSGTHGG